MAETTSEFPLHLSPSQVKSLGTCGEQFRLTRVLKVPERPGWGGIGGSAVHKMTEDLDRNLLDPSHPVLTWAEYFQAEVDEAIERQPSFQESEYYAGGRRSKDWPLKETREWWAEKGPAFVLSWVRWRDACGLEIWEYPDEDGTLTPAIELEVMAEKDERSKTGDYGQVLYVKSIIDRVMWDPASGFLYIIDIKSGSFTDAWPQQMALNNLGFKQSVACPTEVGASYAGFWKSRTGGIHPGWSDLGIYTDEWLWDQVRKAKAIRDQHLFIAQPNNLCTSACGVKKYCRAMGGDPSSFEKDATLTQGDSA